MKVADFIVEKAALLAGLMTQGPVQLTKDKTGNFSQLIWVTPHNLTSDEFGLIGKHDLEINEVAQHDSGLMVWGMFPADIKKLNTPYPGTPIPASNTNE